MELTGREVEEMEGIVNGCEELGSSFKMEYNGEKWTGVLVTDDGQYLITNVNAGEVIRALYQELYLRLLSEKCPAASFCWRTVLCDNDFPNWV